ncbi:MAG: hypothetical protein WCS85_00200 [Candidatus Peribacteraceae bacterium]|jgi:hypothetical protein
MPDREPERPSSPTSPPPSDELRLSRDKTATTIEALLTDGSFRDPKENQALADASAFLRSPTGEPTDIAEHASNIGQLLDDYERRTEAIDAMHCQFLILHCKYYIDAIREELARSPIDTAKVRAFIVSAMNFAKLLASKYMNDSYLSEIQEIESTIVTPS